MDFTRTRLRDTATALGLALLIGLLVAPNAAIAQVRTKKPDRGVYRSPSLKTVDTEPVVRAPKSQIAEMIRQRAPSRAPIRQKHELVEVTLDEPVRDKRDSEIASDASDGHDQTHSLRPVGYDDVILVKPHRPSTIGGESIIHSEVSVPSDGVVWDEGDVIHDGTCDGCPDCVSGGWASGDFISGGCDSAGCDSIGCDCGRCNAPWYRSWANSSLSWDRDRWFGGIEVLLLFPRGDRIPPLITTTSDANPDPDTAGEIGQPGTQILVGGDKILDDFRAGGRLTLGTWIDNQQCRSLVLRGWFAGEDTYGFSANEDQFPVIARPFLNVSDDQAAAQDTQLIAFPDRVDGSVDVRASSDVFGGDLAVRQFWYGKYGGTVDVLYGYQYMRLNEDLSISSTSTSLDDNFAPLGSVLAISDSFEAQNEFHGGQFGVATRYRECCWSFNGLAKVGFGSLSRRAKLNGSTFTSIDGANATDPNGLLVRSTNSGTVTDHTFGWVPELDFSLGWQKYPCFDVTVGYNIVAMTDALQVSGEIDPTLSVNLSDPPNGQQRPTAAFQYRTYYIQGIHFGLQYVY